MQQASITLVRSSKKAAYYYMGCFPFSGWSQSLQNSLDFQAKAHEKDLLKKHRNPLCELADSRGGALRGPHPEGEFRTPKQRICRERRLLFDAAAHPEWPQCRGRDAALQSTNRGPQDA